MIQNSFTNEDLEMVQVAGVTVTLHGVKGTVDGLSNTLAHIGDKSDRLLQGHVRIESTLNEIYVPGQPRIQSIRE
jgi:hypothetical protein